MKEKYKNYGDNKKWKIPEDQINKFSESIAEWADGEAISAHYAFKNNIFCTLDTAKNAGVKSVFAKNNVSNLEKKFGIEILSVDEVLKINL